MWRPVMTRVSLAWPKRYFQLFEGIFFLHLSVVRGYYFIRSLSQSVARPGFWKQMIVSPCWPSYSLLSNVSVFYIFQRHLIPYLMLLCSSSLKRTFQTSHIPSFKIISTSKYQRKNREFCPHSPAQLKTWKERTRILSCASLLSWQIQKISDFWCFCVFGGGSISSR